VVRLSTFGTLSMKAISVKLLLSWLLFAAWIIAVCLQHRLVAQLLILPAVWLVRMGVPRPKGPVFIQRIGFTFAAAFILFLVLDMIHIYDPFPAWAIKTGEVAGTIVCALILSPLIGHSLYSDFRLFKGSPDASA